MMETCPRFATL